VAIEEADTPRIMEKTTNGGLLGDRYHDKDHNTDRGIQQGYAG
jgi:hypothetical protein